MNSIMSLQAFREQMKEQLVAMQEASPPSSRIKIRCTLDKKFDFPDGNVSSSPFEAVILDYAWQRAYYPKPYKRGEIEAPACWAKCKSTESFETMKPDVSVKTKKSETTCSECTLGNFQDNQPPKCKTSVRLALLSPDAEEDSPIWTLDISPTGLGAWKRYLQGLQNHMSTYLSIIGFDPKRDYPSIITKVAKDSTPELCAVAMAKRAEVAQILNQSFASE